MHRTRAAICKASLRVLAVSFLVAPTLASAGAQDRTADLARILSTLLADADARSIVGGEATISWHTDGPALDADVRLADEIDVPIVELTHHPTIDAGCATVSRFEHSQRNRLGGRFAAIGDDPSQAVAELVADEHGARHLRFAYRQVPRGPARLRINLHDPDPKDHTVHYLDGRAFDTIRFWMRSPDESPSLDIGLADAAGNSPIHVGDSSELAAARAGAWSLVSIALQEIPDLVDRSRLATLHLQPSRPGSGTIEIDNLSLCRGNAAPDRPASQPDAEGSVADDSVAKGSGAESAAGKSLWVWHTSDLMTDRQQLAELATMVRRRNIDRVYLQLPSTLTNADGGVKPDRDRASAAAGESPRSALRTVIRSLSAAGAAVDALDGAASMALPQNHLEVERAVRAVIGYNETAPTDARFAGVHYDIEPYLLPGFGGERRSEIVDDYLTVLRRIAALTSPAGLRFEAAIPFWFDSIRLHRPSPQVDGSLSFRLLSEAVIDIVDAVAIMDYRTRFDGSNGTVALAASELEYASEGGKRVRIGLETGFLPDQDVLRFDGVGEPGIPHGEALRPWIVAADSAAGTRMYVVPSSQLSGLQERLHNDGADTESVRHWQGARPVHIDSRRLTFHDVGIERMRSVMVASTVEMRGYAAFEGFAIHYDRPYRRLLDQHAASASGGAALQDRDRR